MAKTSALNRVALKMGLLIINLIYAPILFADSWFPTMDKSTKMGEGQNIMTVLGDILKKGMMILLFVVSVVTFVKFIMTVSHGIEESKKHEGGSLAVFANFAVMGIIYLAISLATGYLGYTVIDKFKV